MRLPAALRLDARAGGALLCVLGLMLIWVPRLLSGAIGLELIATAFWWWSRAAHDRAEQLPRWTWLRRPASALWLAAALRALAPDPTHSPLLHVRLLAPSLFFVGAAAVLWAGLELLAALPVNRPFSDRPGPLPGVGPWLPVLLPAAGFLVLWRHAGDWTGVPMVRGAAMFLLVLTNVLATLRAFSRGRWVASLRWLMVADSALAAILVATRAVNAEVSLLLWLAACGGRAALLAGELRGAASRRRTAHRLWRLSGWIATTALAWPTLVALGFGRPAVSNRLGGLVVAFAVALCAWVTVRRHVEAPERRAVMRREAALPLTQLAAIVTLVTGPVALAMAWWSGFEASWPGSVVALVPSIAGGAAAWWLEHRYLAPFAARAATTAGRARGAADGAYRLVVVLEQRLVRVIVRAARALLAPTRDLHTGDAQEYLLFLVGLSVLALVLPLLR